MTKTLFAVVALAYDGIAVAVVPVAQPTTSELPNICKMVVAPDRGAKPYELCMTKSQWEAKKLADSKDVTRIECRYTEDPKTRFRSYKVCMTAAEWDRQRLEDRQAIERIQMQTCVPGGGC